MRVEWAFACRYAESDGMTATIVGAGIDTFFPAVLPSMIERPSIVSEAP